MSRPIKKTRKTWSTAVTEEEKKFIPCTLCGGLSFKPSLFCEGFSFVKCTGCGLVQMNPQPVEKEIYQRYGERYGNDYLAYELANEEAFLKLQLLALEDAGFNDIEINGNARLLDIGCAVGSVLVRLGERGWKTTGVEISAPQAEYARQKRSLDVRSLSLAENNFPTASFDVVMASHIIEHINDPAGLVREVHRILAPGGRFFITTPNIAGFQAKLFGSRWRSAIFDHLYLFSTKTLSHLLVENGFTTEKTVTWGGLAEGLAPAPLKRIMDKAAKRFGSGDVMIIKVKKL